MRSLICVLFITICCCAVYINAAALPEAQEVAQSESEVQTRVPGDGEDLKDIY